MQLEIEFLEILNGDSLLELTPRHVGCVDHLGRIGLIERAYDGASPVGFVRISLEGEAWLAHYHGRVN